MLKSMDLRRGGATFAANSVEIVERSGLRVEPVSMAGQQRSEFGLFLFQLRVERPL